MSPPPTYTQMRLVNLSGDKPKTEQGPRNVSSPTDKAYVLARWAKVMTQYPHLHLAIEERTVTQTFTDWETVVDKPLETLF
jgi:hypothetical protein